MQQNTGTYFSFALCKLHNHKQERRHEALIIPSPSAWLCSDQIQYVTLASFNRSNDPKSKEAHADHIRRGNVSSRLLAMYVKKVAPPRSSFNPDYSLGIYLFISLFWSPWDKRVLLLQPPSQQRRQGGTGARESKGWKFTAENKCSLFPEVICLCAPLSTDVRPLF